MYYNEHGAENVKIAYIGGGSRGWAWGLMSDLAAAPDMNGEVRLYDIDFEAARKNETIGNRYNTAEGAKAHWDYRAVLTIEEALYGADFVVISILPGTFDEMASDVHCPEKYGIWQSVGDTTGPGGVIRAMRTLPMYEYIGEKIRECCPGAFVISYTNPMTLCIKTLYRVFPKIRAFGCCHEVFGTQKFLAEIAREAFGNNDIGREDIKVNPVGVNHFTWLTKASYRNYDLFPIYRAYCERHPDGRKADGPADDNWMNSFFASEEKVKMRLFLEFSYIAAAGDRHLAEFCPGSWFLESPARVHDMHFSLTPVSFRKEDLRNRLMRQERLLSGEEETKIALTGEEGTLQMRALLGLTSCVTNVNLPNRGQIPNLPLGAVVETNAVFRASEVTPVQAGPVPNEILPMISRIVSEQELLSEGIAERDLHKIFAAFVNDPLVTCGYENAKKLFIEMCDHTKAWLDMYEFPVRL